MESVTLENPHQLFHLSAVTNIIQKNQFLYMEMDGNKILPSCSTDRKTTEKNRRNQMKSLFAELSSLVPHYTDAGSLPDKLDEAAKYIKKLQMSIEKLRQKKEKLQDPGSLTTNTNGDNYHVALLEPELEVHQMGSALEVVLITGLDHRFTLFSKAIRVLDEEGAELVNASFYVASDKVFHIIHSKVEEAAAGYRGTSRTRIEEKLHGLLH